MTRRSTIGLALVLGSLTAIGPLSLDMYLPAFPRIVDDLGAHPSQVQITLTACLVGLALGQIVAGPASDSVGRKPPLLVGTVGYVIASLVCAVAPNVGVLTAARAVQGLTGAAAIVVARAVVTDVFAGTAAARFFSRLTLVTGLAPMLAPLIGAQVLRLTSWRGVFVLLAGIGAVLVAAVALRLPETLPAARRRTGGRRPTVRALRAVVRDRTFLGLLLMQGLAFAALFAYISGSPFVVQDVYGGSPLLFSVLFGVNSAGLVATSQVGAGLVGRVPPRRLLAAGLVVQVLAGLALVAVTTAGLGLPAVAAALFVLVSSVGIVLPNATALALGRHREAAGSASALLGTGQFLIAGLVVPLVGLGGEGSAVPMAVVIAASAGAAGCAFLLLTRGAGAASTVSRAPAEVR